MDIIRLHEPVATDSNQQRLNLFPGRHLGEQEFDLIQAYFDARLAPLMAGQRPGIVSGLDVARKQLGGDGEGFVVQPGYAIGGNGKVLGLYYPLRQTWKQLFDDYLAEPDVTDIAGVYYLVLRRNVMPIDDLSEMDACNRTELDPLRDRKLEMVGTVGLQRLSVSAGALSQPASLVANTLCASKLSPHATVFNPQTSDVPLAMLAIDVNTTGDPSLLWLDQTAGRYLAIEHTQQQTLLNQVLHSFSQALDQLQGEGLEGDALIDALSERIQLDYLPSAGRLPTEMLRAPESESPSIAWFGDNIAIDMVPVAASQVEEVIHRALPHGVIKLTADSRDRLRLLLAVSDENFKPDLLDFPDTDDQLEADVYHYASRAATAWNAWLHAYLHLFYITDATKTAEPELEDELNLPPTINVPTGPAQFFQDLINREMQERNITSIENLPLPYRDGVPAAPEDYSPPDWPTPPGEDGLVVQYALCQKAIKTLEDEINDLESRLEKTRDYLLLQRQQLDSQTISFARLAGGVSGDGSGLKLTRWLPYTRLNKKIIPQT